jgi:hypothetical protein
MPSDHITCPYCPDAPVSHHLFKHILTKHEASLFTGDSRATYNLNVLARPVSKTSPCPPTLYLTASKELLNPYYCCLGCCSAIKKHKFAIPHFPGCLDAHEKKRQELFQKYFTFPTQDLSGTIVQQVVSTVTTTVFKMNNPFMVEALEKYYKRIQELEEDNKKADKKAYRMREWLRKTDPDIAQKFEEAEADISDASDVDEDPNELLRKVVKEHKVEFKIIKTIDEDGNIKFSV